MLYQGLDIHGAVELEKTADGVIPHRLPRSVWEPLDLKGHALAPTGTELRFVPEGEVTITLSAAGHNCATVYYGALQSGETPQHFVIPNTPTAFTFRPLGAAHYAAEAKERYTLPYGPHVVRVLLGNAPVTVHKVEGACRPPHADELPPQTGLFYGSSITQGAFLPSNALLWSRRVAEALGCDHLNLGMAGRCFAERETADWLAARNDWDFAVLELGINMVDHHTCDEFRRRVRYLLETLHAAHPEKYLFCLDIFCYRGDLFHENNAPPFRRAVGEEAARLGSDRVVHIPALDILPTGAGLSTDMVHPGIEGALEIAHNLTRALKPFFNK